MLAAEPAAFWALVQELLKLRRNFLSSEEALKHGNGQIAAHRTLTPIYVSDFRSLVNLP
jgi:hypothetical protein